MGAQYHNGHWYGGGQDIDIQSDPTATSFESGKVPTGDTVQSVLNSNLVYKDTMQITTSTNGLGTSYFPSDRNVIGVTCDAVGSIVCLSRASGGAQTIRAIESNGSAPIWGSMTYNVTYYYTKPAS